MSSHIVEVVPFTLEPCPNSDFLSIAHVKGWQCVVRTKDFEGVDKAVYIPIDSIVPDAPQFSFLENLDKKAAEKQAREENPKFDSMSSDEQKILIDCIASQQLMAKLADEDAKYVRKKYRRVKTIKLRGIISQGILLPTRVFDKDWEIGTNVAAELGITKWEPPVDRSTHRIFGSGGSEFLVDNPSLFHKYTDVENFKNFPDIIEDGEDVVITEKLHGTNFRLGLIGSDVYVGSHNKTHIPEIKVAKKFHGILGALTWPITRLFPALMPVEIKKNPFVYWKVANQLILEHDITKKMREMQETLGAQSIILHGEIFGGTVQDLTYGRKGLDVRCFDISVNGTYLDWDDVESWAGYLGLKTVPVLYRGPFSLEVLKEHTDGRSTLAPDQIREGCVVHPTAERWHARLGRVILKSVSSEYLLRKGGSENH